MNYVPTAGPIGTGEAPIDAPIRRNDDGANPGSIGGTWHVPPREGLQKDVDAPTGQTGGATNVKLTGHTHTTPA